MAVGIAVTACGGEDEGQTSPPGDPPPAPAPVEVDPGCTEDWPVLFGQNPGTEEEARYVDVMPVCSSSAGDSFTISNGSQAVWWFTEEGGQPIAQVDQENEGETFREAVGLAGAAGYPFLAPGDVLEIPGSAEWHIDRYLTALWLAHDIYRSTIEKQATAAVVALLGRESKPRAAVVQCTIAYWTVISGYSEDALREDVLSAALNSAAAAGSCAASWRAAEAELASQRFPRFADYVEKAGQLSDNVVAIRTTWNRVQAFCAATRFC